MYVNGEIVKRKDAVHVNVSLFFLFRRFYPDFATGVVAGCSRLGVAHNRRRSSAELGQGRGLLYF